MKNLQESIGVVLNAYKRTDLLEEQIESLVNQSIVPSKIYIWNNSGSSLIIPKEYSIPILIFDSSENLGVWARFSAALNSTESYIAVMDDDTVPGKKWFENCLNHVDNGDRILGTRGLRFLSNKSYAPFESYGWDNPNDDLVEVDILGHSWFFHRKMIGVFWGLFSERFHDNYCGEDIHLSYSGQKHGYRSFVPPHRLDDLDSWGSNPKLAVQYGTDGSAISAQSNAINKFTKAYRHYVDKGLRIYYGSNKSPAKIVINTNIREIGITHFFSRFPRFYAFLKKVKLYLNKRGIHF